MRRQIAQLLSAVALSSAALLASCGVSGRGATQDVAVDGPQMRSGCADGAGWPLHSLSGDVVAYACPGGFSGPLASRCAPGWAPCARRPTEVDSLSCGSLVDLPEPAARGFYVGAVVGWAPSGQLPDARLECAPPRSGAGVRVLFGCGPTPVEVGPVRCAGYSRAVVCGSSQGRSSWRCDADLPGEVTLEDPSSGVLCCAT